VIVWRRPVPRFIDSPPYWHKWHMVLVKLSQESGVCSTRMVSLAHGHYECPISLKRAWQMGFLIHTITQFLSQPISFSLISQKEKLSVSRQSAHFSTAKFNCWIDCFSHWKDWIGLQELFILEGVYLQKQAVSARICRYEYSNRMLYSLSF
jgi:hypothetical protein